MEQNDLYSAEFIDHIAHPDYKYEMKDPTMKHEGINPSCGDDLELSVKLDKDGKIAEAAYTGHGCAVSQASADMMSDLMVGKTPEEAIKLCDLFTDMVTGKEKDESKLDQLEEAASLEGVSHMPARVKCAELSWRTLKEMLKGNTEKASTTEDQEG
ncbi:MAG: SUF system NifU family Fe-S cluster assembly protein [Coriobacteriaceae bacterium]|nr:MAG: SUF system NifU family Fe-S cluster assembly protein [Coriobacteriaceae bacterium]